LFSIRQDRTDCYPFGLKYNSYSRENSLPNTNKLFQGQEHIDDLGLNWDSFKWRNHQPDIGRFFSIDPLSEKYYYNSPYAFSENHVTTHIELEGLEKVYYQEGLQKNTQFQNRYQTERQTSGGKEFSKAVEGQKKYDVAYSVNKTKYDGVTTVVPDSKEMDKMVKKDPSLKSIGEQAGKTFAGGKKLILFSVDVTSNEKADTRSMNHEEVSHGMDVIKTDDKNGINEDHKDYYGPKCSECVNGMSPSDYKVQSDPKFKGSKAEKNYNEIDKLMEKKPR
jgi:RHS repeat-associated protein